MLSLEPGLAERFDSALDCVRAGVYSSHRPLKAIAAEMDTSVSTLSRKLAAHPDDPRHFTLARPDPRWLMSSSRGPATSMLHCV